MSDLLDGVSIEREEFEGHYRFRFPDGGMKNATMTDVMLYTMIEQLAVQNQLLRQIEGNTYLSISHRK